MRRTAVAGMVSLTMLVQTITPAVAAYQTDISNIPMLTLGSERAKPNFMLILDDSNSMELEAMPGADNPGYNTYRKNTHPGSFSHLCNKIYFDPDPKVRYELPPNPAKGLDPLDPNNFRRFDPPSFSAAPANGFFPVGPTNPQVTLGTNFGIIGMSSAELQRGFYYRYELATDPNVHQKISHSYAVPCWELSNRGADGKFLDRIYVHSTLVWTKVPISSADEERFARWYSFYRTRFNVMKSAAGNSFIYPAIDESVRVGMITITPTENINDGRSAIRKDKFLPPRDFTLAQRAVFLKYLYSQRGTSETPLRSALARVGRYYGGQVDNINQGMIDAPAEMPGTLPSLTPAQLSTLLGGIAASPDISAFLASHAGSLGPLSSAYASRPDPLQFSCQRNYSLLVTDGYWSSDEAWTLTPANGNSTVIRTEDSGAAVIKPMNDRFWYEKIDHKGQRGARMQVTNSAIQDNFPPIRVTSNGTPSEGGTPAPITSGKTVDQLRCDFGTNAANFVTTDTEEWAHIPGGKKTLPACPGATNAPSKGGVLPKWIEINNISLRSFQWRRHALGYPADVISGGWENDPERPLQPLPCNDCADAPKATKLTGSEWEGGKMRRLKRASGATTDTFDLFWESHPDYNTYANGDSWTSFGTRKHGNYFIGCAPLLYVCGKNESGPLYEQWIDLPAITGIRDGGFEQWYWKHTDSSYMPSRPVDSNDSEYMLADVAMYYYNNDLRDNSKFVSKFGNNSNGASIGSNPVDVSRNNVTPLGNDTATWQHMVTYTMGLGVSGYLKYHPDYLGGQSADFEAIKRGAENGGKSWIDHSIGIEYRIDDLWHAAINGRGRYLSAQNPIEAAQRLSEAIEDIQKREAGGTAASTSNLEPRADDNAIYSVSFTTSKWTGEIKRQEISVTDIAGTPNPVGAPMYASALLDARVRDACDTRAIYLQDGSDRMSFSWDSKRCDDDSVENGLTSAWKTRLAAPVGGPFQDNNSPRAPSDLVNYLRGQKGREITLNPDTTALQRFRKRESGTSGKGVLGDIVNSQPLFVKVPYFEYTDPGYTDFKKKWSGIGAASITRDKRLYVGANDGMLHSFDADTLAEKWAVIPSALAGNLSRLSAPNYKRNHQYFVDGSPAGGDVYDPSAPLKWRTIIVSGYNAGGKGYMALDVTDPNQPPRALWEFVQDDACPSDARLPGNGKWCDRQLGMSFGNPIVTKVRDSNTDAYPNGRWVVIVTSGYNNDNDRGYLYLLDALTGQPLKRIDSTVEPGDNTEVGLAKINNWVHNTLVNNLTEHVYGGTLRGELVRFDFTGPWQNASAARIATYAVAGADGNKRRQPITIRPELAVGASDQRMVFVGTGRFLGDTDLGDTLTHSVYALVDANLTTSSARVREDLERRVFGAAANDGTRPIGPVVGMPTKGWYIDMPAGGERIFTDLQLQLGTLAFVSNEPSNDPCVPGGKGFLNFFDYRSGGAVAGMASKGGIARRALGDALGIGLGLIRLPTGELVAVTAKSDGVTLLQELAKTGSVSQGRRASWREIVE